MASFFARFLPVAVGTAQCCGCDGGDDGCGDIYEAARTARDIAVRFADSAIAARMPWHTVRDIVVLA